MSSDEYGKVSRKRVGLAAMSGARVWRSAGKLADGREIVYYDEAPGTGRADAVDQRPLGAFAPASELRWDPLVCEWVIVAAHRQDRTFLPPADSCPLDASGAGGGTEVPAADYDVVVFENRFPSLASPQPPDAPAPAARKGGADTVRPGYGHCDVVCFTSDHGASFADLPQRRVRTVIEAWADRSGELAARPEVAHVYPFENRGEAIGVTLQHCHGQIYGYPMVPPRIARMTGAARAHHEATGGNLFDDHLAAHRAGGARQVVAETGQWCAFVPQAARWPFEIHLFPLRRVPGFPQLDDAQREDLAALYPRLLRSLDDLFEKPAPYIAAWNQAPVSTAGLPDPGFALHLDLFSFQRDGGKLKHLAGSESGMGTWINDVTPEDAARRLRAVLA